MKNQKETIRKMVRKLNEPEENGGFWLPNIQRPFVWSEEQIERLFDSIMREYPISTLLVWKTKAAVKRRKFIDNYRKSLKLTDFYHPSDDNPKQLVLDGQQRLQSLFIGLKGSYEGRELYFNVTSGKATAPDDVRFKFKFLDGVKALPPWFLFKDLVTSAEIFSRVAAGLIARFPTRPSEEERERVQENLALVEKTFKTDESIAYQELDSIDRPELYTEEDVVEVFIRANSGGTRLDKSDLLFSLLLSTWDVAVERTDELLADLNAKGYAFTRDFVLKTCLTLLDQGARYEVEKFRETKTLELIESRWTGIADAIRDVQDYLYGRTFVRDHKAMSSYLTLIPVVYFRYRFPDLWPQVGGLGTYFIRTLLTRAFTGQPDQLIDEMVARIRDDRMFDVDGLFELMRNKGRSLELTPDRLFDFGYGSADIHLLFNLWYDFEYRPAYAGNLPQVDHIFPQSLLSQVKEPNERGRKVMKYDKADRDQLANCMLLTAAENGAGGKGDTPPAEWLKDKPPEYLALHLIPPDPELWKVENYEVFIEARKALILDKFSDLVRRPGTG